METNGTKPYDDITEAKLDTVKALFDECVRLRVAPADLAAYAAALDVLDEFKETQQEAEQDDPGFEWRVKDQLDSLYEVAMDGCGTLRELHFEHCASVGTWLKVMGHVEDPGYNN